MADPALAKPTSKPAATLEELQATLPYTLDPEYKPLPGRLGNLTIPQQHSLEKLKKELKEEEHWRDGMSDEMLLRFLRARKFDHALTKTMLLAAEKWRKDFGVDEIVKSFDFKEKEQVNKYYPSYYHKNDKDGRPIWIEQLGKLDIKALYEITTSERQLKRLVLEYETFLSSRLPASAVAAHHPVETTCTILDLNNVSLSNFYKVKDYVAAASSIGQDRYPETMGKFYIINAPYLFSAVWSVIKLWLDEVTVAKIQIISGTAAVTKALLEQIREEDLPVEFGGKCTCGGPPPSKGVVTACSMSDAGPWKDSKEGK